jgi:hypothetical protein
MEAKKKLCSGCSELQYIWKKEGKQRFCKSCWSSQNIKGLSSTKKPTAKKPLSPRSSKQEKLDALYSILRKKYLENHPMCEARLPGCGLSSTDIHHKAGRTGDRYLDDTDFLSVCRVCHQWIELHPTEAKLLDFSKSRES